MRTEGPLDTNVGPRCHMVAFLYKCMGNKFIEGAIDDIYIEKVNESQLPLLY